MQVYGEDSYLPEEEKQKKNYNHYLKTVWCIIFFLTGFVGLQLIAYVISEILGNYPSLSKVNAEIILNSASYVVLTIVFILLLYFATPKGMFKHHFKAFAVSSTYSRALLYFLIMLSASYVWGLISLNISNAAGISQSTNANQSSLVSMLKVNPIIISIMTIFLAPFCEELTYRYGLFEALKRHNKVLAYILSLVIFGLIHFDFTGCFYNTTAKVFEVKTTTLINELLNIPSYFIGGGILAYAYDKEDNIATPMMTHLFNNAFSIIITLVSMGAK